MSRYTDNLERLCNRLRLLYGNDDPLTLEVRRELEAQNSVERRERFTQDWTICYDAFVKLHRDGGTGQAGLT